MDIQRSRRKFCNHNTKMGQKTLVNEEILADDRINEGITGKEDVLYFKEMERFKRIDLLY